MVKLPDKTKLEETIKMLRGQGGGYVTFEINGRITERVLGEISSGGHTVKFDSARMLDGDEAGLRPGEYALIALAGCILQTTAWHASLKGIKIDSLSIRIKGKHALLPMFEPENGWPGMQGVEVELDISTPEDPQAIVEILNNVKRGAPVLQTFVKPSMVLMRTKVNGKVVREEVITP